MVKNPMKKLWWFVGVGIIFTVGLSLFLQFSQQSVVSFSWNATELRGVKNFGVDSSSMRTELGYSVDPNSYHPRYVSVQSGCVVSSFFTNTTVDDIDEEAHSSAVVSAKLGVGNLQNSKLSFDSQPDIVPVKSGFNVSENNVIAGFGRFFEQESVILVAVLECEDEQTLRDTFPQVLQAFKVTSNGSTY